VYKTVDVKEGWGGGLVFSVLQYYSITVSQSKGGGEFTMIQYLVLKEAGGRKVCYSVTVLKSVTCVRPVFSTMFYCCEWVVAYIPSKP
jgi:hypothetical protein